MTDQEKSEVKKKLDEKRLARWVRFLAVIYRVVLVAGLLTLITAIVLLIVTNLFTGWILLVPIALIVGGVILARVEYRLDMRLYNFNNQPLTGGGK